MKKFEKKSWHAGWLYPSNKKIKRIQMIQQNNFDPASLESSTLSLVQFKSEYNGACQLLHMIFKDLQLTYNGVANFFTVDFEKEKELSNSYGVMEIPTILFFINGKIIDHTVGLTSKNILVDKIESALANLKNA